MKNGNMPSSLKEALARVLGDPSRDNFRDLLRHHTGEGENLDFKAEWPNDEKLARHVLALGNSGGGCIVVGVSEDSDKSITPLGLSAFKDKAEITRGLDSIIPTKLMANIRVEDFDYNSSDFDQLQGKKFQLLLVQPDYENMPFLSERDRGGIRTASVFVRRGTESVEANQEELQRIINARIATGHSTTAQLNLEEHLDQLFVLQKRIPREIVSLENSWAKLLLLGKMDQIIGSSSKKNPKFPAENAQDFVIRMFEAKKIRIARELDVK